MRRSILRYLLLAFVTTNCLGQQLSSDDKALIESARARYYNLEAAGFQSLTCSVKFDFSTVPLLPAAEDDPTRMLIEATKFTLTLDSRALPSVEHHYPDGSSAEAQERAAQVTNLLTSLVTGLFQTWPTKGLQGPIPPFDKEIQSIVRTETGYIVNLRVPGSPVQVYMDKSFLVNRITSIGGKIDERPTYVSKPEGLVFAANEVIDDSQPSGPVTIKYDLDASVVDGLRVPSSVRLKVNSNIDVKYDLSECHVKKGVVVRVGPPPESKNP